MYINAESVSHKILHQAAEKTPTCTSWSARV